jgi:PP-loop superfamily ATP-utilizing enzyme
LIYFFLYQDFDKIPKFKIKLAIAFSGGDSSSYKRLAIVEL